MIEQVAAARQGGAILLNKDIKQNIARDNFERLVSLPAPMLALPTPQCVKLSGLNAHMPPFIRCVNSLTANKPEQVM